MKNTRQHSNDSLRVVEITPNYLKYPEGSVLIRCGDTAVICTATVEDKVKDWLRGQGRGWVTAEYAMLPRANAKRGTREGQFGRWPSSRSQEIQRLIGRSLRAAVRLSRLGERMITIDCDVIQGDGGTRTASITGGFVALAIALDKLKKSGAIEKPPLYNTVAAVSVGMSGKELLLDLNYVEDSSADVDMNLCATGEGLIVEVQGTAEHAPYTAQDLNRMTEVALKGILELTQIQKQALKQAEVNLDGLIEVRQ